MTTTQQSRSIPSGVLVRLSFDTLATSVGLVTGEAETRTQDGQPFVTVAFYDDLDHESIQALPTSILVPVCEWEHAFSDFDGTYASMPCNHDAARYVTEGEPADTGHGNVYAFCLDHAVCFVINSGQQHIETRVDPT